jgi:hypothetical protein
VVAVVVDFLVLAQVAQVIGEFLVVLPMEATVQEPQAVAMQQELLLVFLGVMEFQVVVEVVLILVALQLPLVETVVAG